MTILVVYLNPEAEVEPDTTTFLPPTTQGAQTPPIVTEAPPPTPPPDNLNDRFPDNFMFGSASAAYQIEGGYNADNKGENIWDHLTNNFADKIAGVIKTGNVAANSYEFYKEDVKALKAAGVR